jgi:molybdopterin converting factor small subunit
MKIVVYYLAQLKQAACVSSESIELKGSCTVQELVADLAHRRGEPLRRLLLDAGGALQPTLLIFVGEEQVMRSCPVFLKDGEVITLLTPMAGGQ